MLSRILQFCIVCELQEESLSHLIWQVITMRLKVSEGSEVQLLFQTPAISFPYKQRHLYTNCQNNHYFGISECCSA